MALPGVGTLAKLSFLASAHSLRAALVFVYGGSSRNTGAMNPTLLRPKAVAERYSLSIRSIERLLNRDRNFPRPIRPSSRVVLFERDALDAYFKSKRSTPCAPIKEACHVGD